MNEVVEFITQRQNNNKVLRKVKFYFLVPLGKLETAFRLPAYESKGWTAKNVFAVAFQRS